MKEIKEGLVYEHAKNIPMSELIFNLDNAKSIKVKFNKKTYEIDKTKFEKLLEEISK